MASFFRLGSKKAKGIPGRFEFEILVQEIKPWMPAVPSPVLLSWHRGEKRWGSTAIVMPLIGGSNGDRVYFNETFKIPAALYEKQPGNNVGGYEKKRLLFTLQSATEHPSDFRRTARKTLAMAEIDLAEFASLTTPIYRGILLDVGKNKAAGKPILYFRIDHRRKTISAPLSHLAVGLRGSSHFHASDHVPLKSFNSDVRLVHEIEKTITKIGGDDVSDDDDGLRRPASLLNAQETRNFAATRRETDDDDEGLRRSASALKAQETRNDAAIRRQTNRQKLFSQDYDRKISLPVVVRVPSLGVSRQNSPNALMTGYSATFLPKPGDPVESSGIPSNDQKSDSVTRKTSTGEESTSSIEDRGKKPEQIPGLDLHGRLPGPYASYIEPGTPNEPVVAAAPATDDSIDKPRGVANRSVAAAVSAAMATYEARKAIKYNSNEDSSVAPGEIRSLPAGITSPVSDTGFLTPPSSNDESPRKPAVPGSSPCPPAIPATVTLVINVSESAFLEARMCDSVKERELPVPKQSIVEPPKERGPPVSEQSIVELPKEGWPLLDENVISRTQSQRVSVLPARSSGAPLVIDKHMINKTISEGSIINPLKEMEQLVDENVNACVEDMGGRNNICVMGEARANLAMVEKRAIEELRKKVVVAEAKATLIQEQGEERTCQLEQKLMKLEDELRDSAAIEVALYSITAEHAISSRHMHTPARRLNRLYMHALKNWSRTRRTNSARNSILGLVLVVRACGNDVPRLTFWWSNVIVLRESIMQAGNIEPTSSSTEVYGDGVPSSCAKASDQFGAQETQSQVPSRQDSGKLLMNSDWGEGSTFISVLRKVEEWIHARILECVWWQAMTPPMEVGGVSLPEVTSPNFARIQGEFNKFTGMVRGGIDELKKFAGNVKEHFTKEKAGANLSQLGNGPQGYISTQVWKIAFTNAQKMLCPLQGHTHGCGCLPGLNRMIIAECVARLDVALLNGILRNPENNFPSDPFADPIMDLSVLPIPIGALTFGAGSQLKNVVVQWSTWLLALLNVKDPSSTDSLNKEGAEAQNGDEMKVRPMVSRFMRTTGSMLMLPKDMILEMARRREAARKEADQKATAYFSLLRAAGDLLMLPKHMVLDKAVREEVCPVLSLPLIERILHDFVPDEFSPNPVSPSLLAAIHNEVSVEQQKYSFTEMNHEAVAIAHFPPVIYNPPPSSVVRLWIGEFPEAGDVANKNTTYSLLHKGHNSDDELEEFASTPLAWLRDGSTPGSRPVLGREALELAGRNVVVPTSRHQLLKEVWQIQ